MYTLLKIEGKHAEVASAEEIEAGIKAALRVFEESNADPVACCAASQKLDKDEELTREEAMQCVIWDNADNKAFRAVTLGWLARGILDIRLALSDTQ